MLPTTGATSEAATNKTACERALNTVEILEQIILEMPCRRVLTAQRVSKLWNDTIAGSLRLQVALCSTPLPPHLVRLSNTSASEQDPPGKDSKRAALAVPEDDTALGLTLRFSTPRPTEQASASEVYDEIIDLAPKRSHIFNPLLTRTIGRSRQQKASWDRCYYLPMLHEFAESDLPQEMLLMQAPVTEMGVGLELTCGFKTFLRGPFLGPTYEEERLIHHTCWQLRGIGWEVSCIKGNVRLYKVLEISDPEGVTALEILEVCSREAEVWREFEQIDGFEERRWAVRIDCGIVHTSLTKGESSA
ncbi:uncharacterized protein LTR77_006244 [Saxophila tyrrhenica]|uniref:F-box domain-containing protein n=1 Tax=Saxophila tyrrhenica TaxID=1690608 RepID=A0AAV9PBJ2_9PEZI|nr:hypothetical protein LTR77_006244 [Saxophila tyrrhenica]